jgi:hypothetical protein
MKTNGYDKTFPPANSSGITTNGLTKREYFTAMAMQGLLAGHYEYFTGNADVSVPCEVSKYAVYNADALIAELNKSEQ